MPFSDSILILPPINSTSPLAIDKPNPLPSLHNDFCIKTASLEIPVCIR